MLLDLKFSIGTLSLSSAGFIAALYGMNLKNFIEESDLGFAGVSGWSFIFASIVCGYGLSRLRRVQRVSMWGESGVGTGKGGGKRIEGKGSWRNLDEGDVGLLEGASRRDRGRSLRLGKEAAAPGGTAVGLLGAEDNLLVSDGKTKK
jgi:hypothetical protein